jgi:hypothetical protein
MGDGGVHVATVRSRSRIPAIIGRDTGTLVFDVVEPGGAPMLTITRFGSGRDLRIAVEDPNGRPIGQLRQTSSEGRQFRTGEVMFAVECGPQHLATASLGIRPSDNRYADVQESICDASGAVIATLERQGRFTAILDLTGTRRESSFAYKLDCALRLAEPTPTLLLVTGFTYYLFDRLADGGFFGAISRFVLQPSWERYS